MQTFRNFLLLLIAWSVIAPPAQAMGSILSEHFSIGAVSRSLDWRLLKSTDRASIHVTAFTKAQQDSLWEDIGNRPQADRERIGVLGLD